MPWSNSETSFEIQGIKSRNVEKRDFPKAKIIILVENIKKIPFLHHSKYTTEKYKSRVFKRKEIHVLQDNYSIKILQTKLKIAILIFEIPFTSLNRKMIYGTSHRVNWKLKKIENLCYFFIAIGIESSVEVLCKFIILYYSKI